MTRKWDPEIGQFRDAGKFGGNDNAPAAGGLATLTRTNPFEDRARAQGQSDRIDALQDAGLQLEIENMGGGNLAVTTRVPNLPGHIVAFSAEDDHDVMVYSGDGWVNGDEPIMTSSGMSNPKDALSWAQDITPDDVRHAQWRRPIGEQFGDHDVVVFERSALADTTLDGLVEGVQVSRRPDGSLYSSTSLEFDVTSGLAPHIMNDPSFEGDEDEALDLALDYAMQRQELIEDWRREHFGGESMGGDVDSDLVEFGFDVQPGDTIDDISTKLVDDSRIRNFAEERHPVTGAKYQMYAHLYEQITKRQNA